MSPSSGPGTPRAGGTRSTGRTAPYPGSRSPTCGNCAAGQRTSFTRPQRKSARWGWRIRPPLSTARGPSSCQGLPLWVSPGCWARTWQPARISPPGPAVPGSIPATCYTRSGRWPQTCDDCPPDRRTRPSTCRISKSSGFPSLPHTSNYASRRTLMLRQRS